MWVVGLYADPPQPAHTQEWAKRTTCDHYNFTKFRPDIFILGTLTAQCMYENGFSISISENRPKFPSFSHVTILHAYVLLQITADIPQPFYIARKLTLTIKRILMQSTVWEGAWIDGVIYHPLLSHSFTESFLHWIIPLLSHSAKECSQHPPPSSQPPLPQQCKLVKSMPIKLGCSDKVRVRIGLALG